MELIEKFYNELNQARGFKYLPQWTSLIGIESPANYANLLTNVNTLPEFDEAKHTKANFTGFVKTDSNLMLVLEDFHEESDFAYFENGKLRYSQWNFNKFYGKVHFKDENFKVLKAYKSNKLDFVYMSSIFKLDDLEISFDRINNERIEIYVRPLGQGFCYCYLRDIDKNSADNLSEEDFSDYNKFYKRFKNLGVNVLKFGVNLNEIFSLDEGIEIINKK